MSYDTRSIGEVSSPVVLEALEFRGSSNEDVTAFLGAIRRVAIMHGRQSDYEWLVTYVESCLRGDAMRWFDEKDLGATTKDWSSLRRLFLSRFDTHDAHPVTLPGPVAAAAIRRPEQEAPKAPLPVTIINKFYEYKANHFYKILIVGNSGVGKSCLLSRHIGHGWISSSIPTTGIHFQVHHLLLNEKSGLIKDLYWDVSGAEDRSQLGPYCTGIDVIWIVYDVTDQKSFQDVREWFDLVMRYRPTVNGIRLIGNKLDVDNRRVVQKQQGRDLANELGISQFYETSARTNEGVQEMRAGCVGVWGYYKA
ncbi:GTP-binding protein [Tulasnella sp. JGI-2019a]|nr:GTP-binding protein [Tulasnella sp. JGI-2019a]